MDPVQLATTAITILGPWLAAVAAKAGGKLQDQAVDATAAAPAKIYAFLKEKLAPTNKLAALAVEEVLAQPADTATQDTLAVQLAALLKSNEALRAELAALVASAQPAPPQVQAVQTATASHGSTVIQVAGSGNKIR